MMQPIPDGSTDTGFTPDHERRPGLIQVLSAADHDIYSRAFDAADRGDWTAARGLASQGHDATATRLITWRTLLDKNSGASFADLDGFVKSNPDWPLRDMLLARGRGRDGCDDGAGCGDRLVWRAHAGDGRRPGATGRRCR